MVDTRSAPAKAVRVQVELYGTARSLAGRRQLALSVPRVVRPGGLVEALAEACPPLVGEVILADRSGLQQSYVFNLNGTSFVGEQPLTLTQDDTVLLFSSQAGG